MEREQILLCFNHPPPPTPYFLCCCCPWPVCWRCKVQIHRIHALSASCHWQIDPRQQQQRRPSSWRLVEGEQLPRRRINSCRSRRRRDAWRIHGCTTINIRLSGETKMVLLINGVAEINSTIINVFTVHCVGVENCSICSILYSCRTLSVINMPPIWMSVSAPWSPELSWPATGWQGYRNLDIFISIRLRFILFSVLSLVFMISWQR